MNTSLVVKGSILDVSKGGDVALAMLDAKIVLICDRSSSMLDNAHQGKARFAVEDSIVERLQQKYPGQIILVSFNDEVGIHADGRLPHPNGTTDMASALNTAQPFIEAGLRGVLISDGEPNDKSTTLQVASGMRGKLDVVFVGDEGSDGASFLRQLAKSVGGAFDVNDLKNPKLLEERIERMLLKAG